MTVDEQIGTEANAPAIIPESAAPTNVPAAPEHALSFLEAELKAKWSEFITGAEDDYKKLLAWVSAKI